MSNDTYFLFDPNHAKCFYPSTEEFGYCWGNEIDPDKGMPLEDAQNFVKRVGKNYAMRGTRVVHIEEALELQELLDL